MGASLLEESDEGRRRADIRKAGLRAQTCAAIPAESYLSLEELGQRLVQALTGRSWSLLGALLALGVVWASAAPDMRHTSPQRQS
jgi:hypothetical protein